MSDYKKDILEATNLQTMDEHGCPPIERDEVYVEIFEQAKKIKKNK